MRTVYRKRAYNERRIGVQSLHDRLVTTMEYTKDLDYAIGWNRFNLQLLGIWPSAEDDEKNADISRYRYIVHAFFMLGFITLPQSAYLFIIWGDLDLMTEDLATANVSTTVACIKMFVTRYHLEKLKPLLSAFIEDWNRPKSVEERLVMLHNAKKARTISMLCTVMIQLLVSIYIFLRVVMITQMQRDQMEPDRTLICPAYFPYDVRKAPVFHLTCLGQILGAYSSSVSYTGVDSFISMLVLHVCGQMTNLRIALKNLADRRSEKVKKADDFLKELAAIVKRHEHLNRFAKSIEDSFNVLMLVQILSCSMQVCFQSYQVFAILGNEEEEFPTVQLCFLVLFVTVTLTHLYIYCYVGEMLIVQSSGMGESAYESQWCNLSPKDARNLLFVMHRSAIPLHLTAGKFSTFSMKTFSDIVKTSMGYLSVLLTVSDQKN